MEIQCRPIFKDRATFIKNKMIKKAVCASKDLSDFNLIMRHVKIEACIIIGINTRTTNHGIKEMVIANNSGTSNDGPLNGFAIKYRVR